MDKKRIILPLIFAISLGVFIYSAFAIQFQVALNDFWTVYYYARNMTISEPASLQNSLFPIGYAAILHIFPVQHALKLALLTNSLIASIFITFTTAIAFADKNLYRTIVVFLLAICFPLAFRYGNTTGPDIGTAAFLAGGVYFLWRKTLTGQDVSKNPGEDILAGILLGLAGLWRSHANVAAILIIIAYALVTGVRTLWGRKGLLAAFFIVTSVQFFANVISGHSPFENAQYLNLYKTFYGSTWYNFPAEKDNSLFLDLILADPLRVMRVLAPYYWTVAKYAWPPLILFLVAINPEKRKYALFALITILIYAGPVAFGSSPRAPLTILALPFSCFGFLITEAYSRIKNLPKISRLLAPASILAFVIVSGITIHQWVNINIDFVKAYNHQHNTYVGIQEKLKKHGLTSPDEVFTTNFNFYLPDVPPYQPRFNAGWDVEITWKFREEHPRIPVTSWKDFSTTCQEQGIRFLVLSPYSEEAADFLGALYDGNFNPDNINKIGQRGNNAMFLLGE